MLDATDWRARAEKYREMAENAPLAKWRESWIRLAESCEANARHSEKIANGVVLSESHTTTQ